MTGSAVPRKYSIPPSIFLAFVQVIKRVYIDLSSCCGPHFGRRANAIPVALLAPENDAGALGVPFPHGRYSGSTRPASYSSEPSRASDRNFAGRCPRPPAGANEKPPMVAPVHLLPAGTSGRPVGHVPARDMRYRWTGVSLGRSATSSGRARPADGSATTEPTPGQTPPHGAGPGQQGERSDRLQNDGLDLERSLCRLPKAEQAEVEADDESSEGRDHESRPQEPGA